MEKIKYDGNKVVQWSEVGWMPQEYKRAPVGTIKLSDAIRRGHGMIREAKNTLGLGAGCAMGAALVAEGLEKADGFAINSEAQDRLAKHFGMPQEILFEVSRSHFAGEMTRLQLADWLESQGY